MARPSPSTERTVRVLTFLALHPTERFTLSELARRLNVNKATCHALLTALTDTAFLLRNPVDATYALGPALVNIGRMAEEVQRHLVSFAIPEMRELAERTGVQCGASVLSSGLLVYVAVVGTAPGGHTPMRVGESAPCRPPLGGVQLAWSTERQIQDWLAEAPDPEKRRAFDEALSAIRERGYSISLERDARTQLSNRLADVEEGRNPAHAQRIISDLLQELSTGIYLLDEVKAEDLYNIGHVAAPIFGPDGNVQFALTLMGWATPLTGAKVRAVANDLVQACGRITASLHGRPPDILDRTSGGDKMR